jgi:hypothetical protein
MPGHWAARYLSANNISIANSKPRLKTRKKVSHKIHEGDTQCVFALTRIRRGDIPFRIIVLPSASVATTSLLRSSLGSTALLSKSRLTGNSSSSSGSLLLGLLALSLLDASLLHRGLSSTVDSHCGSLVEW